MEQQQQQCKTNGVITIENNESEKRPRRTSRSRIQAWTSRPRRYPPNQGAQELSIVQRPAYPLSSLFLKKKQEHTQSHTHLEKKAHSLVISNEVLTIVFFFLYFCHIFSSFFVSLVERALSMRVRVNVLRNDNGRQYESPYTKMGGWVSTRPIYLKQVGFFSFCLYAT